VYLKYLKIIIKFVNGASTLVNPSSHDPRIEGLIPASASTERKKIAKRVCEPNKESVVSLFCHWDWSCYCKNHFWCKIGVFPTL
jgi:hypothetical protein